MLTKSQTERTADLSLTNLKMEKKLWSTKNQQF